MAPSRPRSAAVHAPTKIRLALLAASTTFPHEGSPGRNVKGCGAGCAIRPRRGLGSTRFRIWGARANASSDNLRSNALGSGGRKRLPAARPNWTRNTKVTQSSPWSPFARHRHAAIGRTATARNPTLPGPQPRHRPPEESPSRPLTAFAFLRIEKAVYQPMFHANSPRDEENSSQSDLPQPHPSSEGPQMQQTSNIRTNNMSSDAHAEIPSQIP